MLACNFFSNFFSHCRWFSKSQKFHNSYLLLRTVEAALAAPENLVHRASPVTKDSSSDGGWHAGLPSALHIF